MLKLRRGECKGRGACDSGIVSVRVSLGVVDEDLDEAGIYGTCADLDRAATGLGLGLDRRRQANVYRAISISI